MKNVFITGGTSGIGLELAKLYLNQGDRVGVCGRDLSKVPSEMIERYDLLCTYEIDVTDEKALDAGVTDFSSKSGLDIMIANAGISLGSKAVWPDMEAVKKIIDVNLNGSVYAFASALNFFKNQGHGHLVGIASVAGFVGLPGASAYSASKSALIKLCESYSIDLQNFGINVTCICPGFIKTPLTDKNDHSMPFLISAHDGALRIKKAIDNKKAFHVFPWQMNIVMAILRRLPRCVYRFIMKLPVANYSRKA